MTPANRTPAARSDDRPDRGVLIGLCVFASLVFLPVLANDFVVFDDPTYVYKNDIVKEGLTFEGVVWAFTGSFEKGNWDPLNWLTHMLACELFGLFPAGHHFINLALHVAIVGLLFTALRRMRAPLWRAAIVVALFAVHPLHVEPVAWVSERKGMLSSLFWMLTLLAYVRHVELPGRGSYAWVVAWFVLGLMSKPMLVTLPFALLLLDFWPLRRWSFDDAAKQQPVAGLLSTLPPLIREKRLLFIIAFAWIPIAVLSQRAFGAVLTLEKFPIGDRIQNALISYCIYLRRLVWPEDLAVHYPFPDSFPLWEVAGAIAFLGAGCVVAVRSLRTRPYLFVGWFWYLGTLVPVIQIMQIWTHAQADRYVYIPMLGALIAIVWGCADFFEKHRVPRQARAGIAVIALLLCSVATVRQTSHWKDTESLFAQAVKVTRNNVMAHAALGEELFLQERIPEAVAQFEATLKLKPDSSVAHHYMATIVMRESRELLEKRRLEETAKSLRQVVAHDPEYVTGHYYLALALMELGDFDAAAASFAHALQLDSGSERTPLIYFSNGRMLARMDRWAEAAAYLRVALKLKPDFPEARYELAEALLKLDQPEDAIGHFKIALDGLSRGLPGGYAPLTGAQARTLDIPLYTRPTAGIIAARLREIQQSADAPKPDNPGAK